MLGRMDQPESSLERASHQGGLRAALRSRSLIAAGARDLSIVLVFVVVLGFVNQQASGFATVTGTDFGLFVLLVVSLQLMLGFSNQASLAQGAMYGVGAYAAVYIENHSGLPLPAVLLGAAVAGAFLGLLLALPLLRLREHFFAMATLAAQVILSFIFAHLTATGGVNGEAVPISYVNSTPVMAAIFGCDALAIIGLSHFRVSRLGRRVLAVKVDETMAASVGINSSRLRLLMIVVGFAVASAAGALYTASAGYISPDDFTVSTSLFVLTAVIVGGQSLTWGVLIGAGGYSLLNAESTNFPGLSLIILGVVVVVILGYLPGGLTSIMIPWGRLPKLVGRARGTSALAVPPSASGPLTGGAGEMAPAGPATRVATAQGGQREAIPAALLGAAATLPTGPEGSGTTGLGGPTVLSVRGLRKSFGAVAVLKNVNLEIPAGGGQAVAILGQNGAGKTTFVNILTGLVRPDGGSIEVLGHDVLQSRSHHLVGFGVARTFQSPRLLLDATCSDNVLLGAIAVGDGAVRGWTAATARADAALTRVGLEGYGGRTVSSLPFGTRKLIDLARALAAEPRLLLLDEPAAGLSESEERALAGILRGLVAQGTDLLLIEHRFALVTEIASRVVMLDAGAMVFEGTAREALESTAVRERYLGAAFKTAGMPRPAGPEA